MNLVPFVVVVVLAQARLNHVRPWLGDALAALLHVCVAGLVLARRLTDPTKTFWISAIYRVEAW